MNKIIQALREGTRQKLIVGAADISLIFPHSSSMVEVDIQTTRLLLKSIEVESSTNTDFRVEFFEESALSNSRYNSGIVTQENYDVLDLPYIDKEGQGKMYVVVYNESDYDSSYHIEVRGIEMK